MTSLFETINEKYMNVRFYSLLHSDTYKLTRLIWSYFDERGYELDKTEKKSRTTHRQKSDIRDYERGVTFDFKNDVSIRLELEESNKLKTKVVDYNSKNSTINFIKIGDKTVKEVLDKVYEIIQLLIKGEKVKEKSFLSNIENVANKKFMRISSGKLKAGEGGVVHINIDYRSFLKNKELSYFVFDSKMRVGFETSLEMIKNLKTILIYITKKIINNNFEIRKIELEGRNQIEISYDRSKKEIDEIPAKIDEIIDSVKSNRDRYNHKTFDDNNEMISHGKRLIIEDIFSDNKDLILLVK